MELQPINWTEKPGLYEAIVAAGHYVEHINGIAYADDAVAVQAMIDGYADAAALAMAKTQKCTAILAYAKALRDKVIETVSAGEMASWSLKKAEAMRFGADGSLPDTALLVAEAAQRGIALADLVAKVNANAAQFEGAEAAIGGTDGRHRDTVNALTNVDAVVAYDFSAGWPEV